jgi:hypothetical protein
MLDERLATGEAIQTIFLDGPEEQRLILRKKVPMH